MKPQRKLHEKEQQLAHLARVSTLGEMVLGIARDQSTAGDD
ncbi:MAG: hypothetical protein R3C20_03270 [Planctomycetaceae bacterium]